MQCASDISFSLLIDNRFTIFHPRFLGLEVCYNSELFRFGKSLLMKVKVVKDYSGLNHHHDFGDEIHTLRCRMYSDGGTSRIC